MAAEAAAAGEVASVVVIAVVVVVAAVVALVVVVSRKKLLFQQLCISHCDLLYAASGVCGRGGVFHSGLAQLSSQPTMHHILSTPLHRIRNVC